MGTELLLLEVAPVPMSLTVVPAGLHSSWAGEALGGPCPPDPGGEAPQCTGHVQGHELGQTYSYPCCSGHPQPPAPHLDAVMGRALGGGAGGRAAPTWPQGGGLGWLVGRGV